MNGKDKISDRDRKVQPPAEAQTASSERQTTPPATEKPTAPAATKPAALSAPAAPAPAEKPAAAPAAARPTAPSTPTAPAPVAKPAAAPAAAKPAVPSAPTAATPAVKPAVSPAAAKPAALSAPTAPAPVEKPAAAPTAARPTAPSTPTAPAPVAKPVRLPPVGMDLLAPQGEVDAILSAEHRDPFAFLGMRVVGPQHRIVVRAFLPHADSVDVIDKATGKVVRKLDRLREAGFFAASIDDRTTPFAYLLRLRTPSGLVDIEDPYRFSLVLEENDVHLLAEGNHLRSYTKLGAHPATVQGVKGTTFAVWAPHAARVAVIGEFNEWDGRRHGMRLRHDCGVWEIFLPGVEAGALYKYEIKSSSGALLADKGDPVAFCTERAPGTASVVCNLAAYQWNDQTWLKKREAMQPRESPIAIYEVHLPSWRRKPEEGHRWLTYTELAEDLVGYVKDMGFTHVGLLPVSEFDLDASLGYRPFAPFAPTSRWGKPDEFRLLIDRLHQAGIGVILDWVPNHFSDDPHGLREFDGTPLYEHPDPRQRRLPGSDALMYDCGRREVANYLLSNALFWFEQYHIDAIRIVGLAPLLYLDFGRSRGEWTPNRFGGHENLEAIDFIRRLNEHVYSMFHGSFTIAEEESGWPRISHPTFLGGLGFGFKTNPGWVRDTLRYLSRNPVHRKYYHDELTHGPGAAFSENFVLALGRDEVGYGRGSLLRKMPGDRWQKFAQLRLYYGLQYVHPGKKLLFMGNEFAQEREWNSEISLDWHSLDDPQHRGMQALVRDLNNAYRTIPALHALDCDAAGFEWIDASDSDQSVISFLRQSADGKGSVIAVANFTPIARHGYRIGVPFGGHYAERLNTDAELYGGANIGNAGGVMATEEPMHGRPFSVTLRVPPFAMVILQHQG